MKLQPKPLHGLGCLEELLRSGKVNLFGQMEQFGHDVAVMATLHTTHIVFGINIYPAVLRDLQNRLKKVLV